VARRSQRAWREPPHYAIVHGYRRAYRDLGSGPVLLLLHGIGDSSATWSSVAPILAADFRVIVPDLLGHGASDKPRADYGVGPYACGMRDLLSVLDIERATVVGHSLGGGVAMQFAYQFPERCERLVLVGSGGAGAHVHPLMRLLSSPLGEPALALSTFPTVRPWARLVEHVAPLIPGVFGPGQDLVRGLDIYDALSDAMARRAFLRTLRSVVDGQGQVVTMLDRCYLTQGMPTQLVWGARDRMVPVSHAYDAETAMPGSRLEIFPESGHFPHEDEPERFVALVREFARSAPPPFDVERWRALLRRGAHLEAQNDDLLIEVRSA
jgi:pimeloyl-ACP methyl ester carboxylesterase